MELVPPALAALIFFKVCSIRQAPNKCSETVAMSIGASDRLQQAGRRIWRDLDRLASVTNSICNQPADERWSEAKQVVKAAPRQPCTPLKPRCERQQQLRC